MSMAVCAGASMVCTFGAAPSTLVCTNATTVLADGKPIATIQDAQPMTNILPFGMCSSMANPQVAAATAAAMGVLTPQPCIPQTQAWIPTGSMVLPGGKPVVTQDGSCMCMYGGKISITNPGQMVVNCS